MIHLFWLIGGLVLGWIGLRWLTQLARWLQPRDTVIDGLIRPPVLRHVGHDDELRVRTAHRRGIAEAIKADARRIETHDDRSSRLRKAM